MRYKFFTNSERTWQGMFTAIAAAEKSVYIEMYIFIDDITVLNFLDLLADKARSGVRVRIVLDSFGSVSLSGKAVKNLTDAGVEVVFFSSFFHRTHRKIVVVDERVAFVGGVNFHQITQNWSDLAVRVEGRIVSFIVGSFAKDYVLAGGKDQLLLGIRKENKINIAQTWFIEHAPGRGRRLRKIYQEHIARAEKSITLVTPYFMPKKWLIATLHQAVLRGVDVEILVPRTTDHVLVDRVNIFYMYKLSCLGIKFYLAPEMNHAKAMIVDKNEAIMGSHNLDSLSFDWNFESGIFFKDARAVHTLDGILSMWKKQATVFDWQSYTPTLIDYILSPFIRLFSRVF